jgi:uncharacterized protein
MTDALVTGPDTSTPDPARAPVRASDRIQALDTLRGFALLGILLMNIVGFGLPWSYSDPTNAGGADGVNLVTWGVMSVLFEGTMRTIFSMLFGAGVVLLTTRLERGTGREDIADIYYRRTLWLLAFGVVHAYLLLWEGEILYYYGLAGLFLYPFRKASARTLIVLGLVVLASLVPRYVFWHHETMTIVAEARAAQAAKDAGRTLTRDQQDAIDAWDEKQKEMKPPPDKVAKRIAAMRGNYLDVFKTLAPDIVMWQSLYTYTVIFWDAIGMMLLGMGLLKLGVLTGERSYRFYAVAAVLAYAIGLSVNWYETRMLLNDNFAILTRLEADKTYDVGRLALAFGHTAALLLLVKAGWLARVTRRLAAVGQMALTNYIAQTIICIFVFDGFGLGLFGALQRHQLYYIVAGIWIVQLAWSPIWLRHFRFGPLEWVWRSLTYWQWQPMRHAPVAAPIAAEA